MRDKALGLVTLIREKLLERLAEEENRCLREEVLRSTALRVQETSVPLQHVSLQRDVLIHCGSWPRSPNTSLVLRKVRE